jgi:micrococcal nuclease
MSRVVPFRRPFRAVPLRRIAPRWRRKRGRGRFSPIMIVAPLAAFAAVFFWNGPPEAAGVEVARAAPQALLPRGWDADAAALDAQQPGVAITAALDSESAHFGPCFGSVRIACVVDGDTFWYGGEKIRIADINTPEVSSPGCAAEARLGAAATRRLTALLNEGAFALERVDRETDKYGRSLRVVTRGGTSVGATLVSEGLAEEWQGYRRDWC